MADPMYRQIADDLRKKIESKDIKPGSQLPTEEQLSRQYDKASRNTVREAVKVLADLGLVKKRPGRGTFVVDQVDPLVVDLTPALERVPGTDENVEYASTYLTDSSSTGRQPSSSGLIIQVHVAEDEAKKPIAKILDLQPDAKMVSRHQQKTVDGVPFSLQTTYYPYDYVDRGANRLIEAKVIYEGAVPYLQELLGFREVGYTDRLTVRRADRSEADFFRLESAVLIVEIGRVSFDDGGKPIRYTVTVYPSDRNQFEIRAGDVPTGVE